MRVRKIPYTEMLEEMPVNAAFAEASRVTASIVGQFRNREIEKAGYFNELFNHALHFIRETEKEWLALGDQPLTETLARKKLAVIRWFYAANARPDGVIRSLRSFYNSINSEHDVLESLLGEKVLPDPPKTEQELLEEDFANNFHYGEPCKKCGGNIYRNQTSKRKTTPCQKCHLESLEKRNIVKKELVFDDKRMFHGNICKKCNSDIRFLINHSCVVCQKRRHKEYNEKNKNIYLEVMKND